MLSDFTRGRILDAVEKFETEDRFTGAKIHLLTVSGSRLFGTSSDDSDVDVRGCFSWPTKYLWNLPNPDAERYYTQNDSLEFSHGDIEFQIHEIHKFLKMMWLESNFNFVEESLSPFIVIEDKHAPRIRQVADWCISKQMWNHVRGMSKHTEKHAEKENFTRPKRNLYLLRELLRSIVLFEKCKLVSNVNELASIYDSIPRSHEMKVTKIIDELIDAKNKGKIIDNNDVLQVIDQLKRDATVSETFTKLRPIPYSNAYSVANKILYDIRIERL